MVYPRPPKGHLRRYTRALHMMQNDAADLKSCKRKCEICIPSQKIPGHSHLGQMYINPLDSVFFGRELSPPRRPDCGDQQDVIGTHGVLVCF